MSEVERELQHDDDVPGATGNSLVADEGVGDEGSEAAIGAVDGGQVQVVDAKVDVDETVTGVADEDDDYEEDGSAGGAGESDTWRLPKIKRKSRKEVGDEEAPLETEEARVKPNKKRSRPRTASPALDEEEYVGNVQLDPDEVPGPDLSTLDPDSVEYRRAHLDQIIRNSQKSGKKKRRARKGEDILDTFGDEEVIALREAMIRAADEDEDANRNRRPATSKLKLLTTVISTMQKANLQQSIVDNNLLEGVRRWLEPLPDKSLPALNIQRQFFALLDKMEIDKYTLSSSGLGRIVKFYTLRKGVDPGVQKSAEALVDKWTRPILNFSASYRDRPLEYKEYDPSAAKKKTAHLHSGEKATTNAQDLIGQRHARIPQSIGSGYTVAPRTMGTPAGRSHPGASGSRSSEHDRYKAIKQRMNMRNKRA